MDWRTCRRFCVEGRLCAGAWLWQDRNQRNWTAQYFLSLQADGEKLLL